MSIPQCIISEIPDTLSQSMIAYKILTEYFWKFQLKSHCGNVVNMPYLLSPHIDKLLGLMNEPTLSLHFRASDTSQIS